MVTTRVSVFYEWFAVTKYYQRKFFFFSDVVGFIGRDPLTNSFIPYLMIRR